MKNNIYVANLDIYKTLIDSSVNDNFEIQLWENKSEKDLLESLRKEKKDSAIFISKQNNINFTYKNNGTWLFSNSNAFDLFFSEKLGLINLKENPAKDKREIFYNLINFINKDNRVDFNVEQNIGLLLDQIMFYSDDWKNILEEWDAKYNFLRFSKKTFKKGYSELILNDLSNDRPIPGIPVEKIIKAEENEAVFANRNSIIGLSIIEEKCNTFAVSTANGKIDSHYLIKGISNNLRNNILNLKVQKKIGSKEIALSLFGVAVFVIFSYLTFTQIFQPQNVNDALSLMFQKEAFKQPWIYLLWTNFIISYLFSFLLTLIITILVVGKKPNWKMAWNVFIGRQIRMTARFVTGAAIIGTILMAWYLAKENKVKVSSYVGTMASISIIRIPLQIILITPFMIIGQSYFNEMISPFEDMISDPISISFLALSWVGYVWSIIHHSIIPIVIILPFAHKIYNQIVTKITLNRKNNNIIETLTNKEISILSMKRSVNRVVRNKRIIFRTTLAILIMIFLEALESMYIFEIVESSSEFSILMENAGLPSAHYYNFIELSGLRLMINNVYQSPIINIIPGNGILVIEYYMTHINELIFYSKHAIIPGESYSLIGEHFAQQTSFLTRFFNVYLQRFLSMILCLYVLLKIFIRKTIQKI